jgi:multiple sugar transport system permease protein
MNNRHRRFWRSGYGKTTLAALFVLVYLFPVYWMIATSLKSSGDIFAVPPKVFPIPPDLSPYNDEVLHNPVLATVFFNIYENASQE